MKKSFLNITALLALAFMFCLSSCKEGSEESDFSSNDSHKSGENCMNCHKSGGEGEGVFSVAGTVYDSTESVAYNQATIKLYTGPNATGTLVSTLKTDSKGNFYTTKSVDFSKGLYTMVSGATGNTEIMQTALTNGQCNNCHGRSYSKITIK